MCIQEVYRYDCNCLVDAEDIRRCDRARYYNYRHCGEVYERIRSVPEICRRCARISSRRAARDTERYPSRGSEYYPGRETTDRYSARETDRHSARESDRYPDDYPGRPSNRSPEPGQNPDADLEAVIRASAQEFQAQQRARGAAQDEDEEEEMIRRIMQVTMQEAQGQAEREEEEAVRRALDVSRREWEAEGQAMDNWTQRGKGYVSDDDDDEIDRGSGREFQPGLVPVPRPSRSHGSTSGSYHETAAAEPSRVVPSSSNTRGSVVASSSRPSAVASSSGSSRTPPVAESSRRPIAPPASVAPQPAASRSSVAQATTVNAADAARNRWANKSFPAPAPEPTHPAATPTAPSASNSQPKSGVQKSTPASSRAKGKAPARTPDVAAVPAPVQPSAPTARTDIPNWGTGTPQLPRPEQVLARSPQQPKAPARTDIPNRGTRIPQIPRPNQAPAEPARPRQEAKPASKSDIPNWGTGTPQLPRPGQNPAPAQQKAKAAAHPQQESKAAARAEPSKPSKAPVSGINIKPLARVKREKEEELRRLEEQAKQEQDRRQEDEKKEEEVSGEESEATPPPSPRTLRRIRLAALEKRDKESGRGM